MNTWHYLTTMPDLFWPGVLAGLAVAALSAALSVLVVLKRLAFVGQGISHAAFGGVGVVAALGLMNAAGVGAVKAYGVVVVFCLGAALLIGWISRRRTEPDTAIGIVLVATMALGAVLLFLARSGVQWETFLFGSILAVSWVDAAVAGLVAAAVVGALWWFRRPLVFWAFDPVVAAAMGVREGRMNLVLMTLLALATVTTMKLAGVVLATALLVLPGAAALRISARSRAVVGLSLAVATAGVLGGIVLSFELDWPTGPSIVLVLTALFVLAAIAGRRVRSAGGTA